jgi:hypothetical protein
MAIKERPHYELSSTELARWLEWQGDDRWWNVDGDPFLGSHLHVPCPGDEFAAALRRFNRPLLLADKDDKPEARGQVVRAEDLDPLADRLSHFGPAGEVTDRALYLSWKGSDLDWLLVEDGETSESEARDARRPQEAR